MAITNAQQFKQLVNPPMKGKKRPGYRGDDAARSSEGTSGGRADPGRDAPRGDGPARGAPSIGMINEIRRQNLEKAPDVFEKPNQFNVLDFIPGIGTVRRIAGMFGPLDNKQFYNEKVLPAGKLNMNKYKSYEDYMKGRMAGAIDAYGNPINQDDNDNNMILPQTMFAQGPSDMDQEPEPEQEDPQGLEGLRLAFRADGGPIGGEYDFESARQMYGLGKLVKKVTRTVKKIAKSPIGKAALIGGGLGLAGIGPLKGLQTTPFGSSLSNFFGRGSFNPLKAIAGSIDTVSGLDAVRSPFGELISKIPGGAATAGIVGASAIAGLLTPEQEDEAQQLADDTGFSIEEARNSILARARDDYKMDFRARGFRAEGGPAEGKEPVAKKTMPLLDMDGQEMDLRAEGGFVPIGRMEKADDVPARLSKNEFVFTADAVRNAGEGNVDKGAEVMYNMMKNLEAGGEVSEESQGLEGARRMFQTSQRLEEVL